MKKQNNSKSQDGDFKLSEKIFREEDEVYLRDREDVIFVEDVKTFIKKLKEELCVAFEYPDNRFIEMKIDKLAGFEGGKNEIQS